ncbi:hypothetical protein IMSAGC005_03373 [Lachnospiraceae bacterium]|nr:hypothetical protein IMSAGC005_03373 [Lachnospiraceae bacterium]
MKKIIFSTFIIIGMIAIAGIADVLSTSMETEEEIVPTAFEKVYGKEQLALIEAGEVTEGSLCLVEPKGITLYFYNIILDDYIYFRKIKGERYPLAEGETRFDRIEKYNEDIIELYNFKTGETEKTIDFAAIAEENTPGKQFKRFIEAEVIDGKPYLQWKVYPVEEPHNVERAEIITYDLNEERVVDYIDISPPSQYTEEEKRYYKSFYLIDDSWCNFLEINGFIRESIDKKGIYVDYTDSWRDGVIIVEMPASMLPENNVKLYAEFPRLKEYDIKAGDCVRLFFAGYPDAEEIMGMLMEDGTELTYEGCILDSVLSIDGKEHEVSNMDEYIKWCNWKLVNRNLESKQYTE